MASDEEYEWLMNHLRETTDELAVERLEDAIANLDEYAYLVNRGKDVSYPSHAGAVHQLKYELEIVLDSLEENIETSGKENVSDVVNDAFDRRHERLHSNSEEDDEDAVE